MTEKTPIAEEMIEGAGTLTWDEVRLVLTDPQGEATTWLSTVSPDGEPHTIPVGAAWLDGALYFITGQHTKKERNVLQNPKCSIAVAARGIDVVVHGEAARVTDAATLTPLAAHYNKGGWPATAGDGVLEAPFCAPTTGPAPYNVYRITPRLAFALGTREETFTRPTRFRF
jgi:hypothetical protein